MAEQDSRTPGPLVLDTNAADNWRKFLMQFEIYLMAKSKNDKLDKLKVNMLLHCAGPEAKNIVILFTMLEKTKNIMRMFAANLRHSVRKQGMSFMRG